MASLEAGKRFFYPPYFFEKSGKKLKKSFKKRINISKGYKSQTKIVSIYQQLSFNTKEFPSTLISRIFANFTINPFFLNITDRERCQAKKKRIIIFHS